MKPLRITLRKNGLYMTTVRIPFHIGRYEVELAVAMLIAEGDTVSRNSVINKAKENFAHRGGEYWSLGDDYDVSGDNVLQTAKTLFPEFYKEKK